MGAGESIQGGVLSVQGASAELTAWRVASFCSPAALESLGRAFKQSALLDFIDSAGEVSSERCTEAGFSKRLLLQLEAKQLIERHKLRPAVTAPSTTPPATSQPGIELNLQQKAAVSSISKARSP